VCRPSHPGVIRHVGQGSRGLPFGFTIATNEIRPHELNGAGAWPVDRPIKVLTRNTRLSRIASARLVSIWPGLAVVRTVRVPALSVSSI
jgi:hypothetical protein